MQNRASSVEKGRLITRRVFMLAAAKLILLGGITSRLYSLQISDREKYELLSDKNRIREWKTPPQRGFITDHFNNVLADNDRVFQVHLDLDQIQDFNNTIFKLKNILELSNNELKKIYREKERLKPWDTLVASDNLSWTQFSKLNLYLHELEGVKPVVSSSRFYPYKDDLVHVVGYVGAASQKDIERDDIIKENEDEKTLNLGRDKSGTKVKKDGILESPKVEVFRKFYSKRWSFERWRRAILLQEPGEFFYPSLIGDLLSPEHKTSTKTQFLFERMQLRSWILKLKTYISTTKCGRMKRL